MLLNNNIITFSFKDILIKDVGEESDARLNVLPDIPRFHHIIHFVLDGSGKYRNSNAIIKGESSIRKNQAFGIFKNDTVNYISDKDDPFYYYWVGFDGEEAERIMRYAGFTPEFPVVNVKNPKKIISAFKALITASKRSDLYKILTAFLRLVTVLHDNNESVSGDVLFDKENYILKTAEDFIKDHVTEKITINELAKEVNVSREHFSRLFKEKYNISPHKYIARSRLKLAETMLTTTDLTITQIAEALSFSDIYTFSKTFKSIYRVSPSEFRKLPPPPKNKGKRK